MEIIGNNNQKVDATEGSGLNINITQDHDLAGSLMPLGDLAVGLDNSIYRNKIGVSDDYRVRSACDILLFSFIPTSVVSTNDWKYARTLSLPLTSSAGQYAINSTRILTSGASGLLQTCRSFQVMSGQTLTFDMSVKVHNSTNPYHNVNVQYFGLFTDNGSTTPTSGIYWKCNGNFVPVINYNGTEFEGTSFTFSDLLGSSENIFSKFSTVITDNYVYFYVNGDLKYRRERVSQINLFGPSDSAPLSFKTINTNTATSAAILTVGSTSVYSSSYESGRDFTTALIGSGNGSFQTPSGTASSQSCSYANSANPTAAVPSNTLAALGVGLGGQFWETNTLALNTDGIISSYQVPIAGSFKTLYITGVTVSSYVQALLVTGGYNEQWSLAFGHSAVSLATAESATTKAPRRAPLGIRRIPAASAVGTNFKTLEVDFTCPIAVYAGEFVAVVKKNIGIVGTGGVLSHLISFNGYWE